jgi:hypothetical protein
MLKKILAVIAGLFASASAFAVPPATLADLTVGINFTDVGLAILAVTAALIVISVTWKGAKMVLRALG